MLAQPTVSLAQPLTLSSSAMNLCVCEKGERLCMQSSFLWNVSITQLHTMYHYNLHVHPSTQSKKPSIPMQIYSLFIDNRDDIHIMTALGSAQNNLAIFTTRVSKPLTCGKYNLSLQDCIIHSNGCCQISHIIATVLNV